MLKIPVKKTKIISIKSDQQTKHYQVTKSVHNKLSRWLAEYETSPGEKLQSAREAHHLILQELADAIGTEPANLRAIENNQRPLGKIIRNRSAKIEIEL